MTDYISREKFIVTCVDVYCKNCDRRKNGKDKIVYDIGDAPCRTCDIMCVLNDIECFTPADVAPVVHAEWKINADGYYPYCSACRKEPPGRCMTAHCPNCGAIMDGGKKNAVN